VCLCGATKDKDKKDLIREKTKERGRKYKENDI
jgi:hypothetical protein